MYPIPANATRIRYLESTGTQYVDTLTPMDGSLRVVMDYACFNTLVRPFGAADVRGTVKNQWYLVNDRNQAASNCSLGSTTNANIHIGQSPVGVRTTATIDGRTLSAYGGTATNPSWTLTPRTDDCTLGIFACHVVRTDGSNPWVLAASMRLYSCAIYDGSTLVRSYVPVRVGQVGYLFDRVSGQLFGNAGTGSFVLGPDTFAQGVLPTRMMAMGVRKTLLPNGYIELQFVNTNGDTVSGDAKKLNSSAAFNTGFTPSSSTVVNTTICPGNNGTGEWETFIGGSTSGDTVNGSWLLRRSCGTQAFAFTVNSWTGSAAVQSFTNETTWVKMSISITSVDFTVNGTTTTKSVSNSSSFTGVAPIWIGAAGRSTYGNSYRGCKALIGRTTITDNGVVVRDYVPAMRKSDSVCGFYDLVASEFKTSTVANHVFTSNGY